MPANPPERLNKEVKRYMTLETIAEVNAISELPPLRPCQINHEQPDRRCRPEIYPSLTDSIHAGFVDRELGGLLRTTQDLHS